MNAGDVLGNVVPVLTGVGPEMRSQSARGSPDRAGLEVSATVAPSFCVAFPPIRLSDRTKHRNES
jgi:hypothetical protein